MRVSAPLIHNGQHFLPEGSVIELSDDGIITGITDSGIEADIQYFDGILCPGFVNAHCHLELSHLKGKLPENTGLIPFLQKIPSIRMESSDEEKYAARHAAYDELLVNGVVAVGDIANTTDALDLRQRDQLHVHSFIECLGFSESAAAFAFEEAKRTEEAYAGQQINKKKLRRSLVPHAPYSVARKLFELINQHEPGALISIHNQESLEENSYYLDKSGGINDLLATFHIDHSFFNPSGKTSLQTYMQWLSPDHRLILVHNTYTTKEDVEGAMERFKRLYWCLCPNANVYIENTLPDVMMLKGAGAIICIGTDSLASNHQLNILSELITLKQHFASLNWETLIRWGTWNGAAALNMEDTVGSIAPGKQPGILNIQLETPLPTVQRIA